MIAMTVLSQQFYLANVLVIVGFVIKDPWPMSGKLGLDAPSRIEKPADRNYLGKPCQKYGLGQQGIFVIMAAI